MNDSTILEIQQYSEKLSLELDNRKLNETTHKDKIALTLENKISQLKVSLALADRIGLKDGHIPHEVEEEFILNFNDFCTWINQNLGDESPLEKQDRVNLGEKLQYELLPYLLLTHNGERWYSKPRGYAGDFFTIEEIYKNSANGKGRLGPIFDRCFLNLKAAQAVQNRRSLLREQIQATLNANKNQVSYVLSLASGPARELFDTYALMDDPNLLNSTCVDMDFQALAFVADIRDKLKLKKQMRLENRNLVYVTAGKQNLDLPPQDLIYSVGLIDYFKDSFVIALLNKIHSWLRPGGRVIMGNFHPKNPSKAMMDYVLDWKLIHRSEEDMNRLFKSSKFNANCNAVLFEEQQVNLFAVATKL